MAVDYFFTVIVEINCRSGLPASPTPTTRVEFRLRRHILLQVLYQFAKRLPLAGLGQFAQTVVKKSATAAAFFHQSGILGLIWKTKWDGKRALRRFPGSFRRSNENDAYGKKFVLLDNRAILHLPMRKDRLDGLRPISFR